MPLAIVGPTASGKTRLSLSVAQRLQGEIVSADSRQMYRHLDIGTSKPGEQERAAVPHHFFDFLDPNELFSAGLFGHKALNVIGEIIARGFLPILVGGSGLYIRAVVDGLFEGPSARPELRQQLEQRLEAEGIGGLLNELERVDPVTAEKMKEEPKARRVIRALEVYHATGIPLSSHHALQSGSGMFQWIQIGLDWSRADLYKRIDERVDTMFSAGLVKEVQWLADHGYGPRLNALNTVGYKEVFDYLNGKHRLEECISLVKRNTRRFAKRQLTWFRADKRIQWLIVKGEPDWESIAGHVEEIYRTRQESG